MINYRTIIIFLIFALSLLTTPLSWAAHVISQEEKNTVNIKTDGMHFDLDDRIQIFIEVYKDTGPVYHNHTFSVKVEEPIAIGKIIEILNADTVTAFIDMEKLNMSQKYHVKKLPNKKAE